MNFRYFSKGDFFLALATFSSGVLLSVELRWGAGGTPVFVEPAVHIYEATDCPRKRTGASRVLPR